MGGFGAVGAAPRCRQGEVRIRSCGCAVGTEARVVLPLSPLCWLPSQQVMHQDLQALGAAAAHLCAWLQRLQVGRSYQHPPCCPPCASGGGDAAVLLPEVPLRAAVVQLCRKDKRPIPQRCKKEFWQPPSVIFARAKRGGVILTAKFQNSELIAAVCTAQLSPRSGNVDCTNTHCTQRCEAQ